MKSRGAVEPADDRFLNAVESGEAGENEALDPLARTFLFAVPDASDGDLLRRRFRIKVSTRVSTGMLCSRSPLGSV